MSKWLLRSISAAGEGEYDVGFVTGDEERTFRFTADEIAVGEKPLLTFMADAFEGQTLYSRDSAKAVIQAVFCAR